MTPWQWVRVVLLIAVFAAAAIGGTLLLATGNGDPNTGPIGRP